MASKQKQELAPAESAKLPAGMDEEMFALVQADAGKGVKDMTLDDVGIPYLYVLQSNSPQVNVDHPSYVRGATAGMFFNNLSGEIYDGRESGLTVIPCAYERKYVEWVDRDEGGGWIADHDISSNILSECHPDDKKRPRLGNNHLIVETAYHYLFMKNPVNQHWEQIVLPTKSTFLKKSRRWNKALMATMIPNTDKVAPRWLYLWTLKTTKEQRDTNVWSNIDVTKLDEMVNIDQYRAAKQFAELIEAGMVSRARETVMDEPGSRETGDGKPQQNNASGKGFKDEIPF
jgi:hypothetical protein